MSNDDTFEEIISDPKKEEKKESPKKEEKKVAKKVKPEFNAINVYNGKMFIRQYSKSIHGKDFAKLAEEFSRSRGYGVEAVNADSQLQCPACGHKFNA